MGRTEAEVTRGERIRIMVVDDHPIVRLGLRELIHVQRHLVVCAEAADATTAWKEIQRVKPDMVIVDIDLRGRDGICLVKQISRYYSDIPVLVVTGLDESRFAERCLLAGARGYIMKQEAVTSIMEAIHCVLRGKIYLSEKLKDVLLIQFAGRSRTAGKSSADTLSDRELEVYRLLGFGFGTQQIAQELNLSKKTIGCYRERIKKKLCLKNGNELVRNAIHWIEDGHPGMEAEN